MIITELNGGLGNQMFQYAVARRLAIMNRTDLKLDISIFDIYKLRAYELTHFNIDAEFAEYNNIAAFKEKNRFKKAFFKLKNRFIAFQLMNVHEKYFGESFLFDKEILNLSDNVYLQGYWQSEKYFKDIETIIRNDFTLKEKLNNKSCEVAELISKSRMPVSIHIRRGDYVSNPITNSVHGTCSLEYYQQCIKILENKFSDLQLFIFSDDPNWVKCNLNYQHPMIFVNHNGEKCACEDMYLMSLCKHNIIANSSFSWWGAWLNNYLDKIVFAPKQWFRQKERNTDDLIPENWMRL